LIPRQKAKHSKEKDENKVLSTPSKKRMKTTMIQGGVASSDPTPSPSDSPTKKGKRTVKSSARVPTPSYKKYDTSHYTLYDLKNPSPIAPVGGAFVSFGRYDNYRLFINGALNNLGEIPTSGVRIDDLTISRVINTMKASALHRNWPADLNKAGMIRATRVPLGHAAKIYMKEGEVDIDEKVVKKNEEGYFYKWWRGIHCLMGQEGFDANQYLIRPSFETFRCAQFSFKVGYRAVLQAPEGQDGTTIETKKHAMEEKSVKEKEKGEEQVSKEEKSGGEGMGQMNLEEKGSGEATGDVR